LSKAKRIGKLESKLIQTSSSAILHHSLSIKSSAGTFKAEKQFSIGFGVGVGTGCFPC
jgi:hypothetical protein